MQDELERAKDVFLWRWKPRHCRLFDFRFEPIGEGCDIHDLLETLRGVQVVYVGDSITAQQYYSFKVRDPLLKLSERN